MVSIDRFSLFCFVLALVRTVVSISTMRYFFDGRTRTCPAREVSRCTKVEMSGALVDIHRVADSFFLSLYLQFMHAFEFALTVFLLFSSAAY